MSFHLNPALMIALIGVLGIGSQWLAWRLRLPAIVLMLVAGLLAGPAFGVLDPAEDLGKLFKPIVAIAVALILFEGGLTLNFKMLRDAGPAVRRLVYVGAPLGWVLATLAIHFGAGLSWESASVLGGILVVTGPTVITPLLRQSRLSARPASVLRWEAIVNDPVGAIFAVLAFELISTIYGANSLAEAAMHLVVGITVATILGAVAGWLIVYAFRKGLVPEYMKVPVLLAIVLGAYALSDGILHESGLLAVTVMGVWVGNAHLPSLSELKRFKEHVTVILVSGVFILLAASLDIALITGLNANALLFVLLIVFAVRPITIFVSLIGTNLTWQERGLIAWIGPRGVVAVAVSGLFGARLVDLGVADGALLAPFAFCLVAVTVIVHGFSIGPLARLLGLTSREPDGVLIAGASRWATALAAKLQDSGIPVMIVDRNWSQLKMARQKGVPNFRGEILSETAEHSVPLSRFSYLIAATDNDAYNALICTDFGPEFGRQNVYQVGRYERDEGVDDLPPDLGGRTFGTGLSYATLSDKDRQGWEFAQTQLTQDYSLQTYLDNQPEAELIAWLSPKNEIVFQTEGLVMTTSEGSILAFRKGASLDGD